MFMLICARSIQRVKDIIDSGECEFRSSERFI